MAKINIKKIEKEIMAMKKARKNNKLIIIGVISIVAIVALILIIAMSINKLEAPSFGNDRIIKCTTKECFVDAANECEAAEFITKIETVKLKLSTDDNCILTKKVLSVDSDEPESIQELFRDKEMICEYRIEEFSPKYVEQISYDMLLCKGNLVDAIRQIL